MFVQTRHKLLNTILKYGKQWKYSTSAVTEVKDTSNTESLYLPIEDTSFKARKKKMRQTWYEEIKNLETVEEKLFKVNMPRYYGWKLILLEESKIPYNSLKYIQYITRTHVMKEPGLPIHYNNVISTEQLDNIVEAVKNNIADDIAFEHCSRWRRHEISGEDFESEKKLKDIVCKAIIERINKTMLVHLSFKYLHLLNAEVNIEPRLEASWVIGLEPSNRVKNSRKYRKLPEDCIDEPFDFPVQYLGQPVVHLRHKHPLREIIPLSECENPDLDVPTYKYSPVALGYMLDRRHVTNIPGFWPGDENEFGLLSYHNCIYTQNRKFDDISEAKIVQAILASYSWLLTQACYQGFSTYNDITYPLTTQTIITDGHLWSFSTYQLNTLLVHSEHIDTNPKRNICWITEPMKLFDKIEGEKIHGLNEEVLRNLVKFYVNVPKERIGVDLKPYLGKSTRVIADIEHDERRNWLEKHYKHLVCNRPRHRRIPEIYQWQKFYLIDHKTCPMHKKREPFEHGIDIFKRRLDDHQPSYIPKCLRENPKKKKIGRWEKTYYP
ncbi:39S ribosomal protein S30, mitochondrial [Harpegnathos saltator]|uniref:28S ribosomal protein S30, mitochondrial n=1 Tax=Harpegnathos saltator TaxID=610380 RepID=E2C4A5_HARSA|nr:39S ribosomal protein S30, mitochondrial [Harpegnathos saltator]EFN77238.1 28S ribosomal protein S30, mitochondrial [Harpegnathos saltator]